MINTASHVKSKEVASKAEDDAASDILPNVTAVFDECVGEMEGTDRVEPYMVEQMDIVGRAVRADRVDSVVREFRYLVKNISTQISVFNSTLFIMY